MNRSQRTIATMTIHPSSCGRLYCMEIVVPEVQAKGLQLATCGSRPWSFLDTASILSSFCRSGRKAQNCSDVLAYGQLLTATSIARDWRTVTDQTRTTQIAALRMDGRRTVISTGECRGKQEKEAGLMNQGPRRIQRIPAVAMRCRSFD